MLKKSFISKAKREELLNDLINLQKILEIQQQQNVQNKGLNSDKKQSIQYDELLFALLKKTVKLITINHFLINKYPQNHQIQNYQNIKQNWIKYLNHQKIVNDAISLLQSKIGQPWKAINLSKDKIKRKKSQFEQYEKQNLKSRKDIKNRMKILKDEMIEVQANMNMAKKEQDVIKFTKNYQELQKQYKYWKQRNRNLKQLSIHDRIKVNQSTNKAIHQKVNKMMTLVAQIEIQEKQIKRLRTLQNPYKPFQKQREVKKFQKIFNYYAKLNTHKSLFFSDLQKNLQKLQLQGFVRFLKDFQLNKVLSNSQVLQIFKKKTRSLRYINLQQFIQIFQDIYLQQCNKTNVTFQPSEFDKYIQSKVLAKDKIKQIFRIRIKTEDKKGHFQNSITDPKLCKYVFSPSTHSGKFKQSINEQLIQNKKSFDFVPCMKSNLMVKEKLKFHQSDKSIQQKSVIYVNPQASSRISQYSKISKGSKLFTKKSSYAQKFRQKIFQYDKSKKNYTENDNQIKKAFQQLQKKFNQQQRQNEQNIAQKQDSKRKQKQKQLSELEKLIGIQQDDQFLERHLLPSTNKIQFNHRRRFIF